mmetsp:Transcript_2101/g.4553  ORF Transcript_2101/g.4553 Transcript_2101/m.4553 type:complete len:306 (-) Transcript_2101:385-1302(-)
MIEGMVDLDTLSRLLRPHPAAPDAAVGTVDVLRALSACPAIQSCPAVHADATPELQAFEAWVLSVNALTQRQLSALSTSEHRALLLLCFRLMQRCCPVVLDAASEAAQCTVNEIATRVLMQAQMLMPRNSWVQQQLAIARTAVLLQSRLWSHTDDECRRLAALALEEGGLPSPRLQLQAAVRPHAAEGAIRSGSLVLVEIRLVREHALPVGDVGKRAADAPVAAEAYWNYLEGLKPEGTPNSLLAAQPLVVTDLSQHVLSAQVTFMAPQTAGKYALRLHIISASVVGVELEQDLEFVVVAGGSEQ